MIKLYMVLTAVFMLCVSATHGIVREKHIPERKIKKEVKRFTVEQTFVNGIKLTLNNKKKKSSSVHDSLSVEALRATVKKNNLSADKISEVHMLDPYFF